MTNQEILDNAPEGATHYENYYNFYWKREVIIGWTVFIDGAWAESDLNDFDDVYDVRSLADIRRIVMLEKLNNELLQRSEAGVLQQSADGEYV